MSAFNTATLFLFAGVSLVALAIGFLSRRYSSPAFLVGLAGLLALTTATTWITVAVPITNAVQPKKDMEDDGGQSKALVTSGIAKGEARATARMPASKEAPAERPEPSAEVGRLVAELKLESSKRAEIERAASDAEKRAAAATARVAELDNKIREAQLAREEAERRAASSEAKLRQIPPTPTPPKPPDLTAIRKMLTEGNVPFYTASEERSLLPGKTGNWYVVSLLQSGRPLSFADRQFVLTDPSEIKAGVVRLRDEVLAPLSQAKKHWRMFVRGAADTRRVTGPVGRDLSYLPALPNGMYASDPRGKRISVPIQNEDLPTLRADWLRDILRAVLGSALAGDIDILENPPQQDHGKTAELVIFVEW